MNEVRFKIYTLFKSDSSRKKMALGADNIERYVIVRRDPDDGGWAPTDGTLGHLRDALKYVLLRGKG